MPKLPNFVDAVAGKQFADQPKVLREVLDAKGNNWYNYIMGLFRDINNNVLKAVFWNLGLMATIIGSKPGTCRRRIVDMRRPLPGMQEGAMN